MIGTLTQVRLECFEVSIGKALQKRPTEQMYRRAAALSEPALARLEGLDL